jgi:hypothetical protein
VMAKDRCPRHQPDAACNEKTKGDSSIETSAATRAVPNIPPAREARTSPICHERDAQLRRTSMARQMHHDL